MANASQSGRPQQARAIATRARLVEAAAALLIDQGLKGTTTAAVAARAGVSQGALFKQFPTKLDLLAASVQAALASLVQAFRDELPRQAPPDLDARLRLGVAALWRVFERPAMQGLFEVYVSARTDRELARAIEPLLAAHRATIHAEARALLPELAAHPGLTSGVDAVVWAMQGASLGLFDSDSGQGHAMLDFFERVARNELVAAGLPSAATRG